MQSISTFTRALYKRGFRSLGRSGLLGLVAKRSAERSRQSSWYDACRGEICVAVFKRDWQAVRNAGGVVAVLKEWTDSESRGAG